MFPKIFNHKCLLRGKYLSNQNIALKIFNPYKLLSVVT